MKNILNGIKEWATESDNSGKNGTVGTGPVPPTVSIPSTGAIIAGATNPLTYNSGLDPEATAAIRAQLEESIKPAAQPALTQLQQNMQKLSGALPDQLSRLKAALAMLDQSNNVPQVLTDITEALEALAAQETAATNAAEATRQNKIGGSQKETAANSARIQQLEQEITALKERNSALDRETRAAESKISATLTSIHTSAQQIRTDLTTLQAQIKSV